jgi:hypothetical protein
MATNSPHPHRRQSHPHPLPWPQSPLPPASAAMATDLTYTAGRARADGKGKEKEELALRRPWTRRRHGRHTLPAISLRYPLSAAPSCRKSSRRPHRSFPSPITGPPEAHALLCPKFAPPSPKLSTPTHHHYWALRRDPLDLRPAGRRCWYPPPPSATSPQRALAS